jgi:hypothetical protein
MGNFRTPINEERFFSNLVGEEGLSPPHRQRVKIQGAKPTTQTAGKDSRVCFQI